MSSLLGIFVQIEWDRIPTDPFQKEIARQSVFWYSGLGDEYPLVN